ncbi:MAG: response regulator [Planctomycetes bacterium]|nr:response regulator [Planctomycetota bacterium]
MATILLVEDDKNQRILYSQELQLEGYDLVTAVDGKDALEKVHEQPPDLIVMDINMPRMDGIETMGKILSRNKQIPIIINTAYSNYKNSFMTWAADAYVVKSSDLTELKNVIRDILSNSSKDLKDNSKNNDSTK